MAPSAQTSSGLRSRKVDYKRLLPVYRFSEVTDIDETSAVNRTIPLLATGVEKEEEEEHHLQAALVANQVGNAHSHVYIPTPDASKLSADYDHFYTKTFQQPKSLIRFSTQVEDVIGCPYNIDEVDDAFLERLRQERLAGDAAIIGDDQLETLMWAFEMAGNDKVSGEAPSLAECENFFKRQDSPALQFKEAIPLVYEHWKTRRYTDRGGKMIQPQLSLEEVGLNSDTDPYVCFRRREIKVLRRVRRYDLLSLEKLRKLRDEMARAKDLLEMVAKRESTRRESVTLEHLIFEQRVLVRRLRKKLGVVAAEKEIERSPETQKRKKLRKVDSTEGRTDQKLRLKFRTTQEPKPFVELPPPPESAPPEDHMRRRKQIEEQRGWLDVTEDPYVPLLNPTSGPDLWQQDIINVADASMPADDPSRISRVPCGRRRVGRGGRILFDRHIRPRDCLPSRRSHGGKTRPGFPPVEDLDVDLTEEEEAMWIDLAQRLRFEGSDNDLNVDIIEMDDTASFMAFRALSLGPREEDLRTLMNKPAHMEQFAPQPTSPSQRAAMVPTPPPLVDRQTASPAGVQKKSRPKHAPEGTPRPANGVPPKKKLPAELTQKDALLKQMMAESQVNAHMEQAAVKNYVQQTQQPSSSISTPNGVHPGHSIPSASSPPPTSHPLPNGTAPTPASIMSPMGGMGVGQQVPGAHPGYMSTPNAPKIQQHMQHPHASPRGRYPSATQPSPLPPAQQFQLAHQQQQQQLQQQQATQPPHQQSPQAPQTPQQVPLQPPQPVQQPQPPSQQPQQPQQQRGGRIPAGITGVPPGMQPAYSALHHNPAGLPQGYPPAIAMQLAAGANSAKLKLAGGSAGPLAGMPGLTTAMPPAHLDPQQQMYYQSYMQHAQQHAQQQAREHQQAQLQHQAAQLQHSQQPRPQHQQHPPPAQPQQMQSQQPPQPQPTLHAGPGVNPASSMSDGGNASDKENGVDPPPLDVHGSVPPVVVKPAPAS
ncbi:enhancer of polycomb-like-domain-containing protein [Blyttiomyces helicus]|uniref:Enhancer of polycomb-like protein n=1 Tax=Blyttiomyces helicus TaxID=388810 RepID=A0A4V1IRL5_9FUNG|nr:enhancer of polycomb-like-domain-containing protein [Blyttiomyces helicus]|eukprot:RKO90477.1 enhancer of polycomb-like-domain-containing protein [Blyttiomyces helicus]